MPLHERDSVRDQFDDCVFADRDLTRPVAKYRFPPEGTLPRDAFQLVADELMLDGNARQNLATFCQTWEEPEVMALMALSVNKNMIDRDEYPQTAEIERRCVHMMADLWNAPEAANTVGTSRISMSQYRANLCQTTCTGPHTMFGLSVDLPAARRLARHRHLAAIPASMHASDEPIAEAPTVFVASGAFHRSAIMWTHRRSISAVWGYSSLSIMFLLTESAIRPITSGSTQVWQKVARFWRALPSSISSSDTSWNASLGSVPSWGNRYLETGLVRSRSANTESSSSSRTESRS